MFITTSGFIADAEKEAINDPSKPVVVIDGKSLVLSCVDNQIGFYLNQFSAKNKWTYF